jgi:GNAT superfamily N-acetyltransferase
VAADVRRSILERHVRVFHDRGRMRGVVFGDTGDAVRFPVRYAAPMEPQVRPAQDSDKDLLMDMAERLQEGVALWRNPDAVRLAVIGWVRESLGDLSDPDSGVFVAERDGEVVGFVCVSERSHFTGEIDTFVGELVVSRAAEGGGVGRALVAAAEDWGRARGRKRVVVDTGAANMPARKFYAALGFEEEDVTVSRAID